MEKFSRWRDKGTGISPFMPVDEPQPLIITKTLSLVQIALKLPLYFVIIGLYKTVAPVKALLLFTLSFLFGLGTLEVTAEGVKKSRITEIESEKPGKNTLVLTNYVSPLTPLIVKAVAATNDVVFLIPDAKGQLFEYSMWDAFGHALNGLIGVVNSTKNVALPPNLDVYNGKMIVLLAEGTPSNNRAILPFACALPSLPLNFAFKVLLIKLLPASLATPLPLVSSFSYIVKLLGNRSSKSLVKVKIFNTTPQKAVSCFESNQLIPVGKDLTVSEKQKFFEEYLKVNRQ